MYFTRSYYRFLFPQRTTVTVPTTPEIVAIGDHSIRKESEKAAALAAVFELQGRGLVR